MNASVLQHWSWEDITKEQSGQRIDLFLTKKYGYSRNFFHHLMERWAVLINWKPAKKSYQLKVNDKIEVMSIERFLDGGILTESPVIELDIRLEKEDYLVLYKPKWLLSHPNSLREVNEPSVVGWLRHRYKDMPSYGNFLRAGLLHRLDKWTDGLMLIAKTERGLQHFKWLFQRKSESISREEKEQVPLHKFYRARSELSPQGLTFLKDISQNLPYYIEEIVKPKVPHLTEYKRGITKILAVEIRWEQAVLDIEILTGRTHQIRYHLSEKWLPISGDYLYWNSDTSVEAGGAEMQLTAWKLGFEDVEGIYQVCSLESNV